MISCLPRNQLWQPYRTLYGRCSSEAGLTGATAAGPAAAVAGRALGHQTAACQHNAAAADCRARSLAGKCL